MSYEASHELGSAPPEGTFAEALGEVTIRQYQLATHFCEQIEPYLAGNVVDGMELRSQQFPALSELRRYFGEAAAHPDRRVLWPAPPNSGKSTMAALVLRTAGVGRRLPDDDRPVKSVIVVPRDYAARQIKDACQHIAPNVKMYNYKPSKSELAIDKNDVLFMTYRGCLDVAEDKWDYIMGKADLLILDEVHRGLGQQIAARLNSAMERYKPTTFALSATPNFSQERQTVTILGIKRTIPAMTPREASEAGIANGVQLIAMHSGTPLHFTSKRGNITEEDLHPLVDSALRNRLIVDIVRDMARLGRQGLVQCVPGASNQHAQTIARLSRQQKIVDPKTGEPRNLRVESIGKHRTKTEISDIIRDFKAGQLDTLTFSKYLVEAFDYSGVRYILAASPTTSAVDMGQLVGRGTRLGDSRVTKLLCLVDEYSTTYRKELQTPFHVYGSDTFDQGQIITAPPPVELTRGEGVRHPKVHGSGSPRPKPQGEESLYEGLSPSVVEAVRRIPSGTILDQMLVVSEVIQRKPPDGYVPLGNISEVQHGKVTLEGARNALRGQLDKDGQVMIVKAAHGHVQSYVSPAGIAYLHQRYGATNDITRQEINDFLASQGWPRLSLGGFVQECKNVCVEYAVLKGAICMTKESGRKLLVSLAEVPFADPEQEMLLSDMVRALGEASTTELLRLIKRNEETYAQFLRSRRRGRRPSAYKQAGAFAMEGVEALMDEFTTGTRIRRERYAHINVPEAIANMQADYRQYVLQNNLSASLGIAAIDAFLGVSPQARRSQPGARRIGRPRKSAPSPQQAKPAPARKQQARDDAPAVTYRGETWKLDPSFHLSGYGNWWAHANCRDANQDLFEARRSPTVALEFCQGCRVKGDCLHFNLQNEGDGTFGGLRQEEHRSLDKESTIVWLESTRPAQKRPADLRAAQNPQYNQTWRA